jgi:hypothetical protein
MRHIQLLYVRTMVRLIGLREDRGDVPGWVLVAVMTAGLVTALWFLADGVLSGVLRRAVRGVQGP